MPDSQPMDVAALRSDADARQRAIRCLWQLDTVRGNERLSYLYAILDAARDEQIYRGLRRMASREHIFGLYQGRAAVELAAVAPYLVCLGSTDRVFDWLWEQGWGESWGIFFWSLAGPETLRAHFRRLTMVQSPEGSRMLFRFYDPRVLRTFLPSCDAVQCRELFGPVNWFACESESGDAIRLMREQNCRAVTRITPLTDLPTANASGDGLIQQVR